MGTAKLAPRRQEQGLSPRLGRPALKSRRTKCRGIFLACGANRPGAPFAEGFFAQRGHAPRRAKPRGIFLPRPGTDGFQVFVTEILGWL